MNPWWLMLIVPVAIYFGFAFCALLVAAGKEDERAERREAAEREARRS